MASKKRGRRGEPAAAEATREGEPASAEEWGNLIQSKEYWDKRYLEEQGEVFEWYGGWESISPVVEDCIARDDRILEVGCGNSGLCVDMAQDGYTDIIAVDFSGAVVAELSRRHSSDGGEGGGKDGGKGVGGAAKKKAKKAKSGKSGASAGQDSSSSSSSSSGGSSSTTTTTTSGLRFEEMDARSLRYADAAFDVCIEKATLDSMMSGEEGMETVSAACSEMSRVLRQGGVLVSVSHLDPSSEDGQMWLYEAVLPALDWKDTRWTVEVHSVEGADDAPHIYILRKEPRPYLTRSLRRHAEEESSPMDARISFIEH